VVFGVGDVENAAGTGGNAVRVLELCGCRGAVARSSIADDSPRLPAARSSTARKCPPDPSPGPSARSA
jgi:hypothetical protein